MKKVIILLFLTCFAMIIFAQDGFGYEENIAVIMAENEAFENVLSLWFTEAETGKAISGANIEIDEIGVFTSDKNGLIYFNTPKSGTYTFLFNKNGYVTLKGDFEVEIGSIIFNKYSIPKALEQEHMKVVLDWSDRPQDLDIHLIKYGEDEYHISFRDTMKLADGTAWLDRNDQDGYGPETITIKEIDDNSEYFLSIHNYSDNGNPNSTSLSTSKAVVRVYINNELVHTIKSGNDIKGIFWHVFTIKNGQINIVNE